MIETLSSHYHHRHQILPGSHTIMNSDPSSVRFEGYRGPGVQEYVPPLPKLLSAGPGGKLASRSPGLTISTSAPPMASTNPSPTSVSSLDDRSLNSSDEMMIRARVSSTPSSSSPVSSSSPSKTRKLSTTTPSSSNESRTQLSAKKQKTGDKPTKKHPKCLYENCTKFARRVGEFQYCMRHLPKNMKRWCIVCNEHIAQYAGRKCASCAGKASTPVASTAIKKVEYLPKQYSPMSGMTHGVGYHHPTQPTSSPSSRSAYHHAHQMVNGMPSPMARGHHHPMPSSSGAEDWYYGSTSMAAAGRPMPGHTGVGYGEYLSMIHELSAFHAQNGLPSPTYREPAGHMWMQPSHCKSVQQTTHGYHHPAVHPFAATSSGIYGAPQVAQQCQVVNQAQY